MQRGKPATKTIDGIFRSQESRPPKRRLGIGKSAVIISVLIIIILGLTIGLLAQRSNESAESPDDVSAVKSAAGQHFLLPTDEEPALATVTDNSKLVSSFRTKAQNGDRILIYQRNKIAILYRSDIDKIIDITPVSIDTPIPDQVQ